MMLVGFLFIIIAIIVCCVFGILHESGKERRLAAERKSLTTFNKLPLVPPTPSTSAYAYRGIGRYENISSEDLDKVMKEMEKVSVSDPDYLKKLTALTDSLNREPVKIPSPKDDVCSECGNLFAMTDDYLCPKCRAELDKRS